MYEMKGDLAWANMGKNRCSKVKMHRHIKCSCRQRYLLELNKGLSSVSEISNLVQSKNTFYIPNFQTKELNFSAFILCNFS